MGHWEGDFDFGYRLFYLFPCAYNIPFCTLIKDPAALPDVRTKSIYQPEENLIL